MESPKKTLKKMVLEQRSRERKNESEQFKEQEDRSLTGRLVDAGIRDREAAALGSAVAPTVWADHVRGENPATLVAAQKYSDGFQDAFIAANADDPYMKDIFHKKLLAESNIDKTMEKGFKHGWNPVSRVKTAADKFVDSMTRKKNE